MTSLIRGANTVLTSSQFTADVSGVTPGAVDLMVFQVTSTGTVRTDDDLIFFNQPVSPEGAVRLTGPSTVAIDLATVPVGIDTLRLAVCLSESTPGSLAAVTGLGVAIGSISAPALGLTTERAAVLVEIYRRGDQWKVRNVTAGWDRGLQALVVEHGVTVDDAPDTPAPAPAPASPVPVRAEPSPPPLQPVRLQKIVLTKSSPVVSLAKSGETGTMRINLNWSRGRKGFFGGGAVDLDLACLYQLESGAKGVVQALGRSFGDLHRPPFIQLDGDDRSGGAVGGENLRVNLTHLGEFTRILVFAYIYEGAPNWSAADGVVTLFPPTGPEVEIRLDSPDNRARTCAIALLKNERGKLTVNREVRYIHGTQSEVSKAYRWGLKWTAGRK